MSRQLLRVTFETPLRHLRDATLPTYPCAPRPPQATSFSQHHGSGSPGRRPPSLDFDQQQLTILDHKQIKFTPPAAPVAIQ